MSAKSKKKKKFVSAHKMTDIAMTVFLWAWVSVFNPTQEDANKLADEVRNIRESMNKGNLDIFSVRDALKDEFDWELG